MAVPARRQLLFRPLARKLQFPRSFVVKYSLHIRVIMLGACVPTDETYDSGNTFSITGVPRSDVKCSIYSRSHRREKGLIALCSAYPAMCIVRAVYALAFIFISRHFIRQVSISLHTPPRSALGLTPNRSI
jgi:hypothetical protein